MKPGATDDTVLFEEIRRVCNVYCKEKSGPLQKTEGSLNELQSGGFVSGKARREEKEKARKEESPKDCDSDPPLPSIRKGLDPLRGPEIEESYFPPGYASLTRGYAHLTPKG